MGKNKVRKRKGSRSSASREREVLDISSLPRPDALVDVPAFEDLRCDEAQHAEFEAFCQELVRAGEDARAHAMRLGFVVRLDRGFPLVAASDGTVLRAEHAVAFAKGADLLPAIGDCVAVRCDAGHDMGVIERVLPRRTSFERWRGKNRGEKQVLAANVDVIFVVSALGGARDLTSLILDRVARSLMLARDCGAVPVIVLTKADRVDEEHVGALVEELDRLCAGEVRIIVTSSVTGRGIDEVASCIPTGSLGVILGESGAGKSTLLNMLLGHEALATSGVRERDDMGRHTTVARVMVALPAPCGVIADAPGLRSLPLVGHERGLARTFGDVIEAARGCRFNDCTHTHEPGCAVREALDEGDLDSLRVEAFLSLADEMRVSAQSLDPDIHL